MTFQRNQNLKSKIRSYYLIFIAYIGYDEKIYLLLFVFLRTYRIRQSNQEKTNIH